MSLALFIEGMKARGFTETQILLAAEAFDEASQSVTVERVSAGVLRTRAYRLRRGLSEREWEQIASAVRRRDGELCRYCGAPSSRTVDHVIPRSRGGTNDFDNLVVACNPCNGGKCDKTPEEWMPVRCQ